jgi:argininosuccinate lyase
MNENSLFEDDIQAIWLMLKANSRQLFLNSRKLEKIEKTLSEILAELRQRSSHLNEDELTK